LRETLRQDWEKDREMCPLVSLLYGSWNRSSELVARARKTVVDDNSGKLHVRETRTHQERPRRLYELPSSFWSETYDTSHTRVFVWQRELNGKSLCNQSALDAGATARVVELYPERRKNSHKKAQRAQGT